MSTKKASAPRFNKNSVKEFWPHAAAVVFGVAAIVLVGWFGLPSFSVTYAETATTTPVAWAPPPLDKAAYDTRLLALAHVATSSPWYQAFLMGTTTASTTIARPTWPVIRAYPADGRAILPFNRVVAYYGNFYSKQMGVLGEYPKDVVLAKLASTTAAWRAADPSTPVVPAIEYIDVTAQAAAGKDGKYRARMSDTQIDKALEYAKAVNGIVILDIQVGLSSLPEELPLIQKYLAMPNVHLAVDPEFAMHNGTPPGRVIGTMSADDINFAAQYLANLVRTYNLPPKILVVHRFTLGMVTKVANIKPLPEVQVVMQMDGWGSYLRKTNTYNVVIAPEPVQFTGFKLFYKNDLKEVPPRLMTPQEVLNLTPSPIFIQYQ
ncbi:MAG: hypothetical protein V4474_02985 [Patescibacteria group bacterium]